MFISGRVVAVFFNPFEAPASQIIPKNDVFSPKKSSEMLSIPTQSRHCGATGAVENIPCIGKGGYMVGRYLEDHPS